MINIRSRCTNRPVGYTAEHKSLVGYRFSLMSCSRQLVSSHLLRSVG